MLTEEQKVRLANLKQMVNDNSLSVDCGISVGKDLLVEIFRGNVPVGGNEKPPEDVNEMLYETKRQRNVLIAAIQKIGRWSSGPEVAVECLHNIERIIDEVLKDVLGIKEKEPEQLEGWDCRADFSPTIAEKSK